MLEQANERKARHRRFFPLLQSAFALALAVQMATGAIALQDHALESERIDARTNATIAAQTVSQSLAPPNKSAPSAEE